VSPARVRVPERSAGRRKGSRASGARLPAALLVVVLAMLAAATLPVACGNTDPFTGVYWEPASGRRIEIRADGDGYKLFYGRDMHPYAAVRDDDELTITDPMGGKSVVRQGSAEGTLELVSGGETTVLRPLPQHQ
jgi:hypothetical protein